MEIYEPDTSFEYDKITLANPQPIQGGSYITKITMDNDKPMYVQFPKCCTKQAIVTTKRGKYCDLMYERERHEELIQWIENLESICQDKLDEKKSLWFTADLTRDDIGHLMSPIARLYKSGKYLLIRTHIHTDKHTGVDKCMAYDEDQVNVDISTIESDRDIIPLVLIDGIRYSSRSFEINIKLTQFMAIDKKVELLNTCMIKRIKTDKVEDVSIPTVSSNNHVSVSDPAPDNIEPVINKDEIETSTHVDDSVVFKKEFSGAGYDSGEDNSTNPTKHLEKLDVCSGLDTRTESEIDTPKISSNEEHKQENDLVSNHINLSIKDDLTNDTNPSPSSLESRDLGNLDKSEYNLEIDTLEEISLEPDDLSESITLKKPNEVYYEIYRTARQKAKHMRQVAVEAYLEAKQIKSQYMLSDIDDSEDDVDFISGGDGTTHSDLEEN
tara:strand:+ start:7151 stop:8470 length:1320 start_codon:yes stop_codon:yes gene_type:complete